MDLYRKPTQVVVIVPPYGSPDCTCGTHATPYVECPLHRTLAILERERIEHVTIDTHEFRHTSLPVEPS